ncbi:YdcH family protein [Citrobacter portucalensis]
MILEFKANFTFLARWANLALFEKHNSLDHEISRLEGSDGRGYSLDIVRLKKQKLHLKEDLLKILQKESVSES